MSQETNSAPRVENKMGTMPIAKLLFNMSLPMMISMLVQHICCQVIRECSYCSFSGIPAADSSYSCCHRDRRWYECLTIQVAW